MELQLLLNLEELHALMQITYKKIEHVPLLLVTLSIALELGVLGDLVIVLPASNLNHTLSPFQQSMVELFVLQPMANLTIDLVEALALLIVLVPGELPHLVIASQILPPLSILYSRLLLTVVRNVHTKTTNKTSHLVSQLSVRQLTVLEVGDLGLIAPV